MHNHHHNHHDHSASRSIGWAFFLNFSFTIIELIGGFLTNSTAIMADAIHDLGDSLSIGLAWILNKLSAKSADANFSYGYRRFSLLGALVNGVILVFGSLWILSEAIPRLFDPVMPHAEGMMVLALLGISVNGFAAYKLSKGKSLNERVLNWHLIEDVLGWVAVMIVSIVLYFFELPVLDPILSIAFTLFILLNVAKTLRETLNLFLQAVPDKKVSKEVEATLKSIEGISGIHHLHLWSLDGEHHVLTAHLVVSGQVDIEDIKLFKKEINKALSSFDLAHTTIELELDEEPCRDSIPTGI